MKTKYLIAFTILPACLESCEKLDTKIDTLLTEENVTSDFTTVKGFGYAAYTKINNGFNSIDNNLFAAVSDEAEQTASSSEAQLFNTGSWNAFNNPDDAYANAYEGIRASNYFLEKFANYKVLLAVNRDTLSDNALQYHLDVSDISWLRNENRVLRAYFYFELLKRYGGVPLVTETLSITDVTNIPKSSFDEIVNFIVSEIDLCKDSLQVNWKDYDQSRDGRLTKAAALAIKARVLLYAASPVNNISGNIAKWQAAAKASYDIIALNQFSLYNNYQNLFVGDYTAKSPETIWAIRLGPENNMEKMNYPIGTPGGRSGVTPSQNLVSAYEYKGTPDPNNPYKNRDPRFNYSIVANGNAWNGRTIEIWEGGHDAADLPNASRTGYYLKKFLNDNLNLVQNGTKIRSWIVFRYGEILLNYAEAMNEAYGPDNNNGYGLTARQAVDLVRNRPGVSMPPVIAGNQSEMRIKIKHERQVELAFEDHRYWDLLRWKDAGQVLNMPLTGIKAVKNPDNTFSYIEFVVENRKFIDPQMYVYPIPQTEISKSKGILIQNPGW
jgi:hypothetical protein